MKVDKITERIMKWKSNIKFSPYSVEIHPFRLCNLKCIFCNVPSYKKNTMKDIKKDELINVTKELCEMGVEKIYLSGGGEPLHNPDVTKELMKIIKSNNITGTIITNGTLWTDELIEKTVDMGWDNIMFSIDGPDAETHDYLRGVDGAFDKAIENIKKFNEMKKSIESDLPSLGIQVTICSKNYKEIPEIVEMAAKLNIDFMDVNEMIEKNDVATKIKLDNSQRKIAKKFLIESEEIAKSYGIKYNFLDLNIKNDIALDEKSTNVKNIKNVYCYEPWIRPTINSDGNVTVCPLNQINLGNIKNKTFSEIWYGKEFNEFRNKMISSILPDRCKNCNKLRPELNEKVRKILKGDTNKY